MATPSSKGLSPNSLCVVNGFDISNNVIKISKTPTKQYSRTLIFITAYYDGYFALITLGLSHSVSNINCCKIEGQKTERIFVKEDSDGNVYIYSSSITNQQYSITFAGSTRVSSDIGSVSVISKTEFDSIATTDVERYA